ncbi:Aste57867_21710 [Aphanomyces stellatus]|uniref:Aste57867_21710 protein n=1 Tax=Aphanomyces stellatus TaxID=120398 RepID=A0A485LIY0_9STRA|nr:hypothetical protein As57867_021641 [Aphanomyces stellatus]VFT98379.1 Aste57867_21710 [Aphanomyces stellatus]
MSLPVDTSQNEALNLQVLQRQDSDIMEILGKASHVVVYEFDQGEQSWKRKEVEGSLFVVKRYTAPRFQMFVNNRLSTVNMTISIDTYLDVDNVDDFLILRCVDPANPNVFKIFGIWFFPEEDRQKTLKLLERVLVSVKGSTTSAPAPPAKQQQMVQQQQPRQTVTAEAVPVEAAKAVQSAGHGPIGSPKKGSAAVVLTKAQGIAAGEAILGMISHNHDAASTLADATDAQLSINTTAAATQLLVPPPHSGGRQKKSRDRTPPRGKQLNKDQFKDAFIQCLDDPAFLDQLYQAFATKLPKAQQQA